MSAEDKDAKVCTYIDILLLGYGNNVFYAHYAHILLTLILQFGLVSRREKMAHWIGGSNDDRLFN